MDKARKRHLSLCTGAALLLCSTAVLAAPDS
ncbi:DUF1161 domain-containing protein, partial [Staphylococcus warneri]